MNNVCNPNNTNMMQTNRKTIHLLIKHQMTISCAESCTGGLLSHLLTNIPGSSTVFLGSIIAYDNAVKIKNLKVPTAIINKHNAVSKPTALAMAQNIRRLLKTSLGLSITGVAGPGGGSKTKHVGLVFIALSSPKASVVNRYLFKGTRLQIKQQAATMALKILFKTLNKK